MSHDLVAMPVVTRDERAKGAWGTSFLFTEDAADFLLHAGRLAFQKGDRQCLMAIVADSPWTEAPHDNQLARFRLEYTGNRALERPPGTLYYNIRGMTCPELMEHAFINLCTARLYAKLPFRHRNIPHETLYVDLLY
jgi:hypothetical protein